MSSRIKKDHFLPGKPCDGTNRATYIEDYLKGKLSIKEMKNFGEHMIGCKACMEEMAFRKEVIEMVEDEGPELFTQAASQTDSTAQPEQHTGRIVRKHRAGRYYRRWAYGVLAAAGLAFLIMLATQIKEQPPAMQFAFDDKVPYPFEQAFLITGPERSQMGLDSSVTVVFKKQFIEIMKFYAKRDYAATLTALNAIEDRLLDLKKAQSEQILTIAREYYFYRGVSILANCTLNVENHEVPSDCIADAVDDLQQSQRFAVQNHLNRRDRDTYFLALAFNYTGNAKLAEQELNKIRIENDFWEQANALQNNIKNTTGE